MQGAPPTRYPRKEPGAWRIEGWQRKSISVRSPDASARAVGQVSGGMDAVALAADAVQDTGAGVDDLMAQLNALNSS